MRSLRSVNLNLLPVLRELLRQRSVTHAAQALNMSQPAVSDALSRLRHILQDEILTADGRQLNLTSRAERMQDVIESALAQMEELFLEAPTSPADMEGVIKIAARDYVILAFGLKLIRRVAEIAPRLTIQFVDLNAQTSGDLSRGAIDFILTTSILEDDGFEYMMLFEDHVICIVPKASPYGDKLSEEEFWAARHAAFAPGRGLGYSLRSASLRSQGRQEFNAVLVDSFMMLPMIVEASNSVAVIPSRLAKAETLLAHTRLAEAPFSFPPICVRAIWHASKAKDPVHCWLREQMAELTSNAETGTEADPV